MSLRAVPLPIAPGDRDRQLVEALRHRAGLFIRKRLTEALSVAEFPRAVPHIA
jgi:hypothetical protein